jgi:polyhydroxybutyrate depolymerase
VRVPLTPLRAAITALLALAASVGALVHSSPGAVNTGLPACAPPTPGTHAINVQSDHPPVLLHVPKGSATERRSLIVVLPGAGQTGRVVATYTGYSRLAEQRNFLVAYPTATGISPFWNVSGTQPGKPDDVAYLRNVITTLTGPAACADPARVGMTGVSNGGGMTARMACDSADLLAAAAPVAGGYSTLPDCEPKRPLALLEIHGLLDEVVPYAGKGAAHAGAVGPYVQEWLGRDHCNPKPSQSAPAHNVLELRWTCAAGRVVIHDRVIDAEHGWPGQASLRPFSSTMRTWRFLNSFDDETQP